MEYYNTYEEPESELNLVELGWDLLSQWKAILIVALVVALVVPSVKLLKDKRDYRAAVKEQDAVTQEQANMSAEELTAQALEGLTEEEQATVLRLAKQRELALTQEAYLNESLLLSGDLANQRTLNMQYILRSDEGSALQPLASMYSSLLVRWPSVIQIGQAIDPQIEPKYIRELISTGYGTVPDSNANTLVATVSVVLPKDADAGHVADAVDALVESGHEEITQALGGHSISLASSDEISVYASSTMDRRTSLTNAINNLLASYKTAVAALTEGQATALEAINQINQKKGADNTDADAAEKVIETPASSAGTEAPHFSLKFSAIGFVAGVFGYAMAYLMVVVLRKRISSADELQDFTTSRLLGDVYFPQVHRGFSKLLHSKLVDEHRYGPKGDVATQAGKVVSTAESVCEHAKVDSVALLCVKGLRNKAGQITKDIAAAIQASGINVSVVDMTGDEQDEKVLLDVKNAIVVASSQAKYQNVWKLTELCRSYDIERLGCVFLKGY